MLLRTPPVVAADAAAADAAAAAAAAGVLGFDPAGRRVGAVFHLPPPPRSSSSTLYWFVVKFRKKHGGRHAGGCYYSWTRFSMCLVFLILEPWVDNYSAGAGVAHTHHHP